jgi:DNA-3-methyladenine glycosylase
MRKILTPDFFDRSTLVVARELLGKYLVRRVKGGPHAGKNKIVALMITETEAYHGWQDKASHARYGKTMRTWPMFMRAGTIYVYFTYGVHWMLNIVCGKEEYPSAVLIRGLVGPGKVLREGEMKRLDGPAKLTKYLQIDKSLNALKLGKAAGLWVEDRGVVVRAKDIQRTPRIGIGYAEEYVEKPWRFLLKKTFMGVE